MSTEVMISKSQIVQDIYANFGQGNIQGITDSLTDDVVWDTRKNVFLPNPRVFTGKDQVPQFFKEVAETVQIPVFEPLNFYENGNTLYVNGRFEMVLLKDNNRKIKVDWTMRWRFKGEKVSGFAEYFSAAE